MANTQNTQLEEYKILRQEHENNRKFVFERPLVIVGGMLAATMGFKGDPKDMLGLLPLIFLAMLWFNLWFTHNRLQSSARIVAYIQLIHELGAAPWIGWENSLTKYRDWYTNATEIQKEQLKNVPVASDSMGFYPPIFYFHLFCGVMFVLLLLIQNGVLQRIVKCETISLDVLWIMVNGFALLAFVLALLPYAPDGARKAIGIKRLIWSVALGISHNLDIHSKK